MSGAEINRLHGALTFMRKHCRRNGSCINYKGGAAQGKARAADFKSLGHFNNSPPLNRRSHNQNFAGGVTKSAAKIPTIIPRGTHELVRLLAPGVAAWLGALGLDAQPSLA
jgi:hypothetical protein